MMLVALSLLKSGVPLSMLCAVIGLVFAFFLIATVIRKSAGNDRMRQISAAVQEGAKAYLNRQVVTIIAIAVVIFLLLFFLFPALLYAKPPYWVYAYIDANTDVDGNAITSIGTKQGTP